MNPSTALATVLVDELLRCGVREAVLAPGSRSTPLALALHDADAEGRLRLHVRVDERSAGFLALGLAKASHAPVPVVTTSGTAAANLHPAVLEADQSGVPLLALTADRPPELRATGANQTIDQVKLFGSSVRLFAEVGTPEPVVGQTAYWRALAARAVTAALGTLSRDPGPVHLNLALREPLVPDPSAAPWPEPLGGRDQGRPWTLVEPADTLAPNVRLPARTLLVVGDTSPALGTDAVRLAEERGWPVVSEPSGNARHGSNAISTGALLLATPTFLDEARPDHVVVVGRPTLSRAVLALLRDPRVAVTVVADHARWADATRSAAHVLPALPVSDGHHPPDAEWLDRWRRGEAVARAAIDDVLDGTESEARLARDLHAALPAGSLLYLGSSMPVRDVFHVAGPRDGVTVLANRGAAGIDGTVSAAMGAALAWQRAGGGPAFALVGDLTLLHDSNGLVLGPDELRPDLTVLVVNNDGGAIFSLLEQATATSESAFERVLGTPHGVDLAALCGATQTPFTRAASTVDALTAALDPRGGLQVVELRTSRSDVPRVRAQLEAAVEAGLG